MDIEKLIEQLRTESLYKDKATLEIMDLCMEAADAVEKLQAAVEQVKWDLDIALDLANDVAPVKHGKWGAYEVFPLTASLNGHPCSECGMRFSTSQIVFMNYCPNCGARMEQEEEA